MSNWFGFLPPSVRYDKRLAPRSQLLFAELSARSDSALHVLVDIKELASLLHIEPRTISRCLVELRMSGHIIKTDTGYTLNIGNATPNETYDNVSLAGPVELSAFITKTWMDEFKKEFFIPDKERLFNRCTELLKYYDYDSIIKTIQVRIRFVKFDSEWYFDKPQEQMDLNWFFDDQTFNKYTLMWMK